MAVTKLQRENTQAAEAMHGQRAELEAQLASAGAELAEVTPLMPGSHTAPSPSPDHGRPSNAETSLGRAAASTNAWVGSVDASCSLSAV